MTHVRPARRPAARGRGLRAGGPAGARSRAASSGCRPSCTCTAAASRASARTSSTTPRTTIALQEAGPVQPLAGSYTLGEFCELIDSLDLFPVAPQRDVSRLYRRWTFHSAALDLALAPGGQAAARGARPRARAGDVRRLAAARRAADARADRSAARATTRRSLQARPDQLVDARADRRAGRDRRRRLGRLQGLYRGTIVDQPPDPVLYRRVVEAFPDAWIEDPTWSRRDRRGARRRPRPDHLGRADPLDRRHRGAAVPAADGQHQAVADRRPARSCAHTYDYCAERGSAPTAAASSSSGPGAARPSTWRRCSTPTPPTTSRRSATTSNDPPPGCPRARCPPRPRRPASAGTDA